jgi:hypothetical protein
MNEPKTAKSFRAAADRILRQESATPANVTRLLAPRGLVDRVIASEDDEWAVRLAALAAVGQWDAVAIVAQKPMKVSRTHNVSERASVDAAIAAAVEDVKRSGSTLQVTIRLTLADGRVADAALVAPLAAIHGVEGALIALRVGRGFGSADVRTASSAAEIVALEALGAATAKREAATGRQALALYELARQGLFGEDLGETLQGIVELLAHSLGHDVAQLWILRSGGSLQMRAAHPREGLALEIARPRDHAALARALAGEVVRAHDPSLRSWVPRTTRDLIVAPLSAGEQPLGVLVFGRWREAYVTEDEEMAASCAQFIARVVLALRVRSAQAGATHTAPQTARDGDQGALTGS